MSRKKVTGSVSPCICAIFASVNDDYAHMHGLAPFSRYPCLFHLGARGSATENLIQYLGQPQAGFNHASATNRIGWASRA